MREDSKATSTEATFKKYTFNFDNTLREQLELIGKRDGRTLTSVLERAITTYIAMHDTNGDEIYNIKKIIQQGIVDGADLMPHCGQRLIPGQAPIKTGTDSANIKTESINTPSVIENVTKSEQEPVKNGPLETSIITDPTEPAAQQITRGKRKPVGDI